MTLRGHRIPEGHVLVTDAKINFTVPGKQFGTMMSDFIGSIRQQNPSKAQRLQSIPGYTVAGSFRSFHLSVFTSLCDKDDSRRFKQRLRRISLPIPNADAEK